MLFKKIQPLNRWSPFPRGNRGREITKDRRGRGKTQPPAFLSHNSVRWAQAVTADSISCTATHSSDPCALCSPQNRFGVGRSSSVRQRAAQPFKARRIAGKMISVLRTLVKQSFGDKCVPKPGVWEPGVQPVLVRQMDGEGRPERNVCKNSEPLPVEFNLIGVCDPGFSPMVIKRNQAL
jgi:hypothetical protein